jgi:AcrR family transcriptional regulator
MPTETSHDGVASAAGALRGDAALNRELVVRAAKEVFSARGLDAPMATVARRAGVGLATLYRRFPTREDLVVAAYTDQLGECSTALEDAVASPDPWDALCTLVNRVCSMQCEDRAFSQTFLLRHPHFTDDRLDQARDRLAMLVARCQSAGRMRPDVTAEDVLLVLVTNAGLVADNPDPRRASARLAAHFLRAFEVTGDHALPPAPEFLLRDHLRSRPR